MCHFWAVTQILCELLSLNDNEVLQGCSMEPLTTWHFNLAELLRSLLQQACVSLREAASTFWWKMKMKSVERGGLGHGYASSLRMFKRCAIKAAPLPPINSSPMNIGLSTPHQNDRSARVTINSSTLDCVSNNRLVWVLLYEGLIHEKWLEMCIKAWSSSPSW